MTVYNLFLPVDPIPKGRPRFTHKGGVYPDPGSADAEATLGILMSASPGRPRMPLDGPLEVGVVCWLRPPISVSNAAHTAALRGLQFVAPWPATSRKDLDNLQKLVFDAGNGRLWEDDRQIVRSAAMKCYALPVAEKRVGWHLRIAELDKVDAIPYDCVYLPTSRSAT